ncbi:MAG TPA: DPP IV N-terminal domain-containing protein [Gemmatimonadales bacterium]
MRLVGIITIAAALGACRPAAPLGSATHPAWAPDGQAIAFISNREGVRSGLPINFEVYVSAVDGAGARRLTTNQEFEADLAWSPDGAHLLVKSFRDGNDEIYLLDRRGNVQRNLTNAPASDGGPSWSPDGRAIVFHSNRDGETRLYLMDADGANVRALPHDPGPGHSPQWSPDGSAIAFVSGRAGNAEIYVVDADGLNVRRLTDDSRENGYPRWSPDGATLAHTAGRFDTDQWSIVLTDRDGANGRILVDSTDSGNAAWSPDGTRLLFGRYRIHGADGGEESELHVLELASGTVTKIRLTLPVTAVGDSSGAASAGMFLRNL